MQVIQLTPSMVPAPPMAASVPRWTPPEGDWRQISASSSLESCPGAGLRLRMRDSGVLLLATSAGGQCVARYNPDRDAFVGQFKWPADGASRDSDLVVAAMITLEDGVLTLAARTRLLDFTARYVQ